MSFGAVAGAVTGAVASGVVGDVLGGSTTSTAASAADPFASQRGQYQDMLSKLISDPSSITSTPGYQFQLEQGEGAVNGSAAASGMLNSGNRGTALETFGQNYASSALTNQETLLSQLAGANIGSPSTAGSILNSAGTAASATASTIGKAVSSGTTNYVNGNSGTTAASTGATTTGNNTYGFTTGATSDPSYGVTYGV